MKSSFVDLFRILAISMVLVGHSAHPTFHSRPRAGWITGSAFASKVLDAWAYAYGVKLDFIRPGKLVENAVIESFNGRFRDECLNDNVFLLLHDARRKIEA